MQTRVLGSWSGIWPLVATNFKEQEKKDKKADMPMVVQRPDCRTCATAFGEEYDMQSVADWRFLDADRRPDWRQTGKQTDR